jgi:NAD-dependent dihydropyrimidine dehydrogenase PreA subunit
MIELIVKDRCTGCGDCVGACPTRVFEPTPDGPVIARQADCQTCFLCELYCPADALYVAPAYEPAGDIDAETVLASGRLGQYRRDSGWGEWADDPRHSDEHWRMGSIFARARAMAQSGGGDDKI